MINLTAVIDNDEAIRKLRELQAVAKTSTSNVVKDSEKMDMAMQKFKNTLLQLGAGVSLMGLARQVAQVRGEFQQLEVAFETMLGNKQKADALMQQMVTTAATTPFGLQDIAGGAKQLLAYGIASEEVNDTLIRLGDIAAGLSIPLGDLVWLYGTTATQGRLFTQDLRQFMGRGIPIAAELAKQFGVAENAVGELVTAGKVGFPEVKKAIESLTDAGGKFGGLMEKQSKTITGLLSNLEDAMDSMFNSIGKDTEGIIAGSIQGAITLVENYEKVLDILVPIVATFGTYKAALLAVAAAQKALLAVDATKTFISMAKSIGVANAAMKSLNITMAASPWAILLGLVAGAGVAIHKYISNTKSAEKATKELNDSLNNEISTLDNYFGSLGNVERGTKAYKGAIEEINSKYGSYFENQLTEKSNADEIAAAYDRVKNAIHGAAIERAKSAYLEAPTEDFAKQETRMLKRLQDSGFVNQLNDLSRGVWTKNVGALMSEIKSSGGGMSEEEVKTRLSEILKEAMTLSGKQFTADNEKYYRIGLESVPIDRYIQEAKDLAKAEEAFKLFAEGYTAEDNVPPTKKTITSLAHEIENQRTLVSSLTKELTNLRSGIIPEGADAKSFDWAKAIGDKTKELNEATERLATLTATKGKGKGKGAKAEDKPTENIDLSSEFAALWEEEEKAFDKELEIWAKRKAAEEEYLINYGSYREQLLGVKQKYDRLMAEAETEEEKKLLEAQMSEELAAYEVQASEWAASLKELMIEQLEDMISQLEEQLKIAEEAFQNLDSTGGEDANELRRKIATLQAQIKMLEQQIGDKDSEGGDLERWRENREVVAALAEEFKSLGEEIGGAGGKAISTAGTIAISVLSIIDGIMTFSKTSLASIQAASTATAKAIAMVEAASVILAVISAVIQVTQALISLFAKGADYSDYDNLKEKYDDLNKVWDQLLEKKEEYISMSYGEEARNVGEEAISLVRKQIEAYRELGVARLNAGASAGSHSIGVRTRKNMSSEGWSQLQAAAASIGFDYSSIAEGRMEGLFSLSVEQLEQLREQAPSFWAQLDHDVQDFLSKIIEGQEQIEELREAYKEQLTQVSFDEVFDSFVDTLMDMDASAEDFSKNFAEYMMRAVLTTQIGEAYKTQLQNWYDRFAAANEDSDITQGEIESLRNEWNTMVEQALELRDGIAEITGYGDILDQQQASVGGFQSMDQETGSELNGRFTDMQGKMAEQLGLSRETLDGIMYIRGLSEQQLRASQDARDILLQMAGNVADIRMFTEALPQISDAISKTNKILDERL